ncbi:MAG TPA: sugar ABC transporter permease [Acetobacteraceae bacterium]|jgi:sn-glycerol 3-phosphate transport system permease protein|nr:sugar ABC transporter permease [Acetobacteraceae bacterium]
MEQHRAAWLLVLPAALFIFAFTNVPLLATFVSSLYASPVAGHGGGFVGLDNYRDLLSDPSFRTSLLNNLIYAAVTVPVSVVLALLMALGVNAAIPGRATLRLSFFLPTMLPMIAVGAIWLFFYTPHYGLVDRFTRFVGLGDINWLGDTATALPAMMAVAIWKQAGFFMIFYLAALQNIPPVLREAASLEGVSRCYFFRRVTVPLLGPTTLFVMVTAAINAFCVVDHVVEMTQGGPDNASSLLLYYVYQAGFRDWDLDTAAAATVVLVLILGLLASVMFALFGRRVHYR